MNDHGNCMVLPLVQIRDVGLYKKTQMFIYDRPFTIEQMQTNNNVDNGIGNAKNETLIIKRFT